MPVAQNENQESRSIELVSKIAATLNEVCGEIENLSGLPVNSMTRDILARRIMNSVEAGETDMEKWKAHALGGFARVARTQ
jgi:hypothetical protein